MTHPVFHVGEVAIIAKASGFFAHLANKECTITGPLAIFTGRDGFGVIDDVLAYQIVTCDGLALLAEPRSLRKRKPPQDATSWSRIEALTRWNPRRETA